MIHIHATTRPAGSFSSWRVWRQAAGYQPPKHTTTIIITDPPWRTCPTCWGAGRILLTNRARRVVAAEICPGCLGVREIPSTGGYD